MQSCALLSAIPSQRPTPHPFLTRAITREIYLLYNSKNRGPYAIPDPSDAPSESAWSNDRGRERNPCLLVLWGISDGTWEYKPGRDTHLNNLGLTGSLFIWKYRSISRIHPQPLTSARIYTPECKSYATIRYHLPGAYPTYSQPLLYCLESWRIRRSAALTPRLGCPQRSWTFCVTPVSCAFSPLFFL